MVEFWEWTRAVNFVLLFAAFMILIYKGVLRMVQYKNAWVWNRFMNFLWTVLALYSLGEVVYKHIDGGPRVLFQTVVALFQLWVVIFKYDRPKDPINRLDVPEICDQVKGDK